jgi:hypothetical protein
MGFDAIADFDAEMAGRGNLTRIFTNASAVGLVDGGDELDIARLLYRPNDGAAHATADAANDKI